MLKETLKEILEKIKNNVQTHSIKIVIICMIPLYLVAGNTTFYKTEKVVEKKGIVIEKDTNTFTIDAKLNKLKESYRYYVSRATPEELLFSFVELSHDWVYKLGGDNKYKQGDCIGTVVAWWKMLGADIEMNAVVNVRGLAKKLELFRSTGQVEKRYSIKRVKSGDIVIFKRGKKIVHMGVVYKTTPKGNIQYIHMGVAVGSWGLDTISLRDRTIYGVYEMPYLLWIGE